MKKLILLLSILLISIGCSIKPIPRTNAYTPQRTVIYTYGSEAYGNYAIDWNINRVRNNSRTGVYCPPTRPRVITTNRRPTVKASRSTGTAIRSTKRQSPRKGKA